MVLANFKHATPPAVNLMSLYVELLIYLIVSDQHQEVFLLGVYGVGVNLCFMPSQQLNLYHSKAASLQTDVLMGKMSISR